MKSKDCYPVSVALGLPIPSASEPKTQHRMTREDAKVIADRAFQAISRGRGIDEAQEIFRERAPQLSKEQEEEFKKCVLLNYYIILRTHYGLNLQKVARHLAKNASELVRIRSSKGRKRRKAALISYAGKQSADDPIKAEVAIAKELGRLLGKRPPRNPSPWRRMLMDEAKKLPERTRGRPPNKKRLNG
jgi:hypothetical protein